MSLTVRPGEIVGLIGANGAGKTTLIRMILGLEAANVGTLAVFGGPPSRQTRRRLGYMPQGLGLYRELSVRENVDFVAEAFDVDGPPLPDALAAVATRQVGALPLGLQRRLAFHCALLHRPELIVLDEPTSGVDPLARTRLWDTIHDQAETGCGVLVTTHYMEEARQCTRLVIMSRGRLVARGSVDDIIGDERAVAVHTDNWAGALTALTAAGLPVTLAGRSVRVAGAVAARVQEALAAAAIPAATTAVPATLEEKLVLIEQTARQEAPT
ncbi:ABC transporter ATP-binding protein [Rhodococcus sp. D2-41]|uniref:ABC transporter ATP-binding protein n=1 Tax=Speluncibacter jeojiensis TaxID=2710754 RepID=A0A9X4M4Q6_9ACTN|nr:ABC transporter ATP-binding protein [Rhodococcus sp. D2-41]MDG3010636.1 ABC transporter ATP-binding protein [Rhodococcus sp. D2-41]MDG3016814.1 ABC transporter ATP-binding protein [Corynebacteriales bacterium D3-21]